MTATQLASGTIGGLRGPGVTGDDRTYLDGLKADAQASVEAAAGSADSAAASASEATAAMDALGLTDDMVGALVASISLELPAAVSWWTEPLYFFKGLSGTWSLYKERELIDSLIPVDLTDETICIHVDRATGNNANTGIGAEVGDFSNAVSNTSTAMTKGIALNKPFVMAVRAGQMWENSWNPSQSSNAFQPTHDYAIIAIGDGRAVFSTHATTVSYSLDTTYTSLYSANRSNILRGLDLTSVDADGDFDDLTLYASPAALQAAGAVTGYAVSGANVYARRADSAAITDANTRFLLNTDILKNNTNVGVSIYLRGIEVHGGAAGCFTTAVSGDLNIITENCKWRYPGSQALPAPCETHRGFNGKRVSVDDDGGATYNDVFNIHLNDDGAATLRALYLRPKTTKYVGSVFSASCNSWTLHERVIGICLEPDFIGSTQGSTVAHINDTKTIVIGGTLPAGSGEATSSAIRIINNGSGATECWVIDTVITGGTGSPPYTMYAGSGGTIHARNLTGNVNQLAAGGGVIDMWA